MEIVVDIIIQGLMPGPLGATCTNLSPKVSSNCSKYLGRSGISFLMAKIQLVINKYWKYRAASPWRYKWVSRQKLSEDVLIYLSATLIPPVKMCLLSTIIIFR